MLRPPTNQDNMRVRITAITVAFWGKAFVLCQISSGPPDEALGGVIGSALSWPEAA